MSLKARDQHALNAIEDRLASSDPRLSSKLATFNRLSAGEAFPAREQIRPGAHQCAQLVWPLLWLAICAALIAAAFLAAYAGARGACPDWSTACSGSAPPGAW